LRRLPRPAALLGILALFLGWWLPTTAYAQSDASGGSTTTTTAPAGPTTTDVTDVIQVSGYLDPVMVDFIERALSEAARDHVAALVLQIDSPGSVVSDAKLHELLDRISHASITVAAWVGPSGAEAVGGAAQLVEAAQLRALAPGSHLEIDGRRLGASEALNDGQVNIPSDCDRARGSPEGCAATIGDLIVSIPGVGFREVEQGGQIRREPTGQTRFAQLSIFDRMMHTVASPPVAYLFFVIGMALLVFELFTAGVGVAGVVGAGMFLLGCYGLAVLPIRPAAVFLLVFAMFGYSVDIQTGVPRVWTGIATVSFALGTLLLYDGVSLSWVTELAGVAGITLAMLAGMPAMVRSRFSTPTIGREWMVGEEGEARTAVNPEGIVSVRGAPWRARTNRATPVAAGEPVRVAAIEGLVLEVEPLVGAAREHRDRPQKGS